MPDRKLQFATATGHAGHLGHTGHRSPLRILAVVAVALICLTFLMPASAYAESEYDSWGEIADEMTVILEDAEQIYLSGDIEGGKTRVDDAYFGYYEKFGFERATLSYISGERASEVEYEFSIAKKAMTAGNDADVSAAIENLCSFLTADASELDGTEESAAGVFIASLIIIVREGTEAVIIVGAIIAYLIKSGNNSKTRAVYIGSVIALAASVAMAFILNALAGAANGQNQEIVEGATMLFAVAVLFYVSNWMVSKSESQAWSKYITDKVEGSISKGSVFSLAFAAFLAIFREGAETILFYRALNADTATYHSMVWLGLAVGVVILVGVFAAFRLLSIRLPLKPFFLGTSILIFVMSISFTGSGIKELQEGNLIGVTPVSGIRAVDILGIYPTAETLIPQAVLLIITVVTFVVQIRKGKKLREEAAK